MEFTARMIWAEGLLLALVAAAVGAAYSFERSSTLAAALREGRPWAVRLELAPSAQPPRSYLALYRPRHRTVELLALPDKDCPALDAVLESAQIDAPGLYAAELGRPAGFDAALDGADWLERLSGAGAQSQMREGLIGPADRWLAWLESRRLAENGIRAAWLPSGAAGARFVAGLLNADRTARESPLTIEVLNATGRRGVAWDNTKALRARGADVINTGNYGEVLGRTVLYDRTGRIENAFALQAMLNCPTARAVTKIDEQRLVDVSVVLAEDCARQLGDTYGNGTR